MDMQEQKGPGETFMHSSGQGHMYIVWGAVILAAVAIAVSFFIVQGARANADYICTHIIEENSDCANGSWGTWTEVSSSKDTAACAVTKIEKRVYTGTRTTRHILQYLNLRTACDSGYTQTGGGSGSGESGFHGGNIITESAACQIEETRTTRNPGAGPECTATPTVTSLQSDIGIATLVGDGQATTNITAKEQLDQFRVSMIAANIYAKPSLVKKGGTTVVKWQGREVTACTVEGTNGDKWEGTSGERTSGIINAITTYTLTCTAFNGQTVTDQATVGIIPVFEEL